MLSWRTFIWIFSASLLSCQLSQDNGQEALARVADTYLYPKDFGVEGLKVDTTAWSLEEINTWISRQIWIQDAEKVKFEANIDQLVLDYKQSLIITAYKEKLLEEADIQITEAMILAYYKENAEKYSLDHELYKLSYYLLDESMEEDVILKKINNQEEDENLSTYCANYSNKCLTEALWVDKGVLEGIELPSYLWNTSAKFERFYRLDGVVGFYRIEGKKKIGEAAPLELVSSEIREILQFQKEKEIIEKHEEKLLLNAQNENSFEIY